MCKLENIYNKCQKLAAKAAQNDLKEAIKKNNKVKPFISFRATTWIVACEHFRKGIIDKETIKNWFAMGFVPEYTKAYEEAAKITLNGIGPKPPQR